MNIEQLEEDLGVRSYVTQKEEMEFTSSIPYSINMRTLPKRVREGDIMMRYCLREDAATSMVTAEHKEYEWNMLDQVETGVLKDRTVLLVPHKGEHVLDSTGTVKVTSLKSWRIRWGDTDDRRLENLGGELHVCHCVWSTNLYAEKETSEYYFLLWTVNLRQLFGYRGLERKTWREVAGSRFFRVPLPAIESQDFMMRGFLMTWLSLILRESGLDPQGTVMGEMGQWSATSFRIKSPQHTFHYQLPLKGVSGFFEGEEKGVPHLWKALSWYAPDILNQTRVNRSRMVLRQLYTSLQSYLNAEIQVPRVATDEGGVLHGAKDIGTVRKIKDILGVELENKDLGDYEKFNTFYIKISGVAPCLPNASARWERAELYSIEFSCDESIIASMHSQGKVDMREVAKVQEETSQILKKTGSWEGNSLIRLSVTINHRALGAVDEDSIVPYLLRPLPYRYLWDAPLRAEHSKYAVVPGELFEKSDPKYALEYIAAHYSPRVHGLVRKKMADKYGEMDSRVFHGEAFTDRIRHAVLARLGLWGASARLGGFNYHEDGIHGLIEKLKEPEERARLISTIPCLDDDEDVDQVISDLTSWVRANVSVCDCPDYDRIRKRPRILQVVRRERSAQRRERVQLANEGKISWKTVVEHKCFRLFIHPKSMAVLTFHFGIPVGKMSFIEFQQMATLEQKNLQTIVGSYEELQKMVSSRERLKSGRAYLGGTFFKKADMTVRNPVLAKLRAERTSQLVYYQTLHTLFHTFSDLSMQKRITEELFKKDLTKLQSLKRNDDFLVKDTFGVRYFMKEQEYHPVVDKEKGPWRKRTIEELRQETANKKRYGSKQEKAEVWLEEAQRAKEAGATPKLSKKGNVLGFKYRSKRPDLAKDEDWIIREEES